MLLIGAAAVGLGGCTVADVSQKGTRVEESFTPANTAVEIRAVFGKTDASIAFASPQMASTVPELQGAFAHYGRNIEDRLLWGYEDYTFVGWVYAPSEWEGYSMAENATLGLSSVAQRRNLTGLTESQKQRIHRYRVWYDSEMHYYADQKMEDSQGLAEYQRNFVYVRKYWTKKPNPSSPPPQVDGPRG